MGAGMQRKYLPGVESIPRGDPLRDERGRQRAEPPCSFYMTATLPTVAMLTLCLPMKES